MRKPRNFKPGKLGTVVSGKNRLSRLYFYQFSLSSLDRYTRAFSLGQNPRAIDVELGSLVLVLNAKRTRKNQGAIPFYIILYKNQVCKIDTSCVRFVENNDDNL